MIELPLSDLEASRHNPRRAFSPEKLAELVASIQQYGVLQPITVIGKAGCPGKYVIVAGERRWRASVLAGKKNIPANITWIEDGAILREMQLEENMQRVQLSPLEEAQAYAELRQSYGYSLPMLATRFHHTQEYIRDRLSLLTLAEEVQQAIEEEQLSLGAAFSLRTIEDADTQRRLAAQVIEERLTIEQTKHLVRQHQHEQRLATRRLKRATQREQTIRKLEALGPLVTSETYQPGVHHRIWDLAFPECRECPLLANFLRDDGQIEDVCVTPACYNSLVHKAEERHRRALEERGRERRKAFEQILQTEEVQYPHLLYQLWVLLEYVGSQWGDSFRASLKLPPRANGGRTVAARNADWDILSSWSYEQVLSQIMYICVSILETIPNEQLPEGLKKSLINSFEFAPHILGEQDNPSQVEDGLAQCRPCTQGAAKIE